MWLNDSLSKPLSQSKIVCGASYLIDQISMCLGARLGSLELIMEPRIDFRGFFMMFDYSFLESILVFRNEFGRSEKFLFSVRITFKKTTKHKSLYLKINSDKIHSI